MGLLLDTNDGGFGSWWDQHRNALMGLGNGIASGNGFSNAAALAAQGLSAGVPADNAYTTLKKAEAERQKQITDQAALKAKYAQMFTAMGKPEIAQGVADGLIDPATAYWDAIKPKAPGPGFELSPGQVRFDENGNQVASVPAADKAPSSPTIVSIYDSNGREQKGYMTTPTPDNPTGFVPVGSPKADTPRPEFSVTQGAAAGYADRMAQSDAIISDPKITATMTNLGEHKGDIPLVGNFIASPEYQQAVQAQRDFINAILRRESGAAISESEFDNAKKQYFPQPGDNEAVLKQKAANRRNAINGIARQAGPAYSAPDTSNYLDSPPRQGGVPTPGQTKVINGVTYTQDENGDWYAS